MQANGAEMMRLAACLATERGLTVCAPVHDAFLIEAGLDGIGDATAAMQAAMREASEVVLPGFALRSDVKTVRHPDRYADPRGARFWATVWALVDWDATPGAGATSGNGATPGAGARGLPAPALPPSSLLPL
jgi:hypothetical protein